MKKFLVFAMMTLTSLVATAEQVFLLPITGIKQTQPRNGSVGVQVNYNEYCGKVFVGVLTTNVAFRIHELRVIARSLRARELSCQSISPFPKTVLLNARFVTGSRFLPVQPDRGED
jgi:hypothetical protein